MTRILIRVNRRRLIFFECGWYFPVLSTDNVFKVENLTIFGVASGITGFFYILYYYFSQCLMITINPLEALRRSKEGECGLGLVRVYGRYTPAVTVNGNFIKKFKPFANCFF